MTTVRITFRSRSHTHWISETSGTRYSCKTTHTESQNLQLLNIIQFESQATATGRLKRGIHVAKTTKTQHTEKMRNVLNRETYFGQQSCPWRKPYMDASTTEWCHLIRVVNNWYPTENALKGNKNGAKQKGLMESPPKFNIPRSSMKTLWCGYTLVKNIIHFYSFRYFVVQKYHVTMHTQTDRHLQ